MALLKPGFLLLICLLLVSCISKLELKYTDVQSQQFNRQILKFADESNQKGDTLIQLNEEIKNLLDGRISADWNAGRKLKALRELLLHEDELHIGYDASATRTASETFYARGGNCLSLTSLFVAAARHVGLDAYFLTVDVESTWDIQGMTMIRYQHIVASGRLSPSKNYVVDFLPDFAIDELNNKGITDQKALSLYFNNLGAEHLVEGKNKQARALLGKALELDMGSSDVWNNMGIAMNRAGNYQLAEYSFRTSVLLNQKNYSALSNLARFYTQADRPQSTQDFNKRVQRYRNKNPYFHFFLAKLNFKVGNNEEAKLLVENAIKLKKDEPKFYQKMAKIYEAANQEAMKEKYLQLAEKYQHRKIQAPPINMGNKIWGNVVDRATRIQR